MQALISAALAAALLAAPALAPPADAQGRQFYGVGTQGPLVADDYNRMQNGRVGTLRFMVRWDNVEPRRDHYSFGHLDQVIGNAAARGVRALPFVRGTPRYVRTPPTRPADRQAFRRLMRVLAQRYSPGGTYWQPGGPFRIQFPGATPRAVTTWQIGNEQNGRFHWGGRPAPRAYGRLVKAGARGLRSVHRRAEVTLGGMFGTPRGKGSLASWDFLNRLYQVKGIKRAFDSVAVHPYAPALRGLRIQMRRIRNVMRKRNHRTARIRVTEIGWGSRRSRHQMTKSPRGQARLLRKSFRLLTRHRNRRKGWNVGGINWFSWQDGGAACPFCNSSGLFRGGPDQRQAKRSWRVFRQMAR